MSKLIVISASSLLIGLGAGVGVSRFLSPEIALDTQPAELVKKPLFYRHPMNPSVTSPVPAKGTKSRTQL